MSFEGRRDSTMQRDIHSLILINSFLYTVVEVVIKLEFKKGSLIFKDFEMAPKVFLKHSTASNRDG